MLELGTNSSLANLMGMNADHKLNRYSNLFISGVRLFRSDDLILLFWPAIELQTNQVESMRYQRFVAYLNALKTDPHKSLLVEYTGDETSPLKFQCFRLNPNNGSMATSAEFTGSLLRALFKNTEKVILPYTSR